MVHRALQAGLLLAALLSGCFSPDARTPEPAMEPPSMQPAVANVTVNAIEPAVPLGPHVVVALLDFSGVNVYHASLQGGRLEGLTLGQLRAGTGLPIREVHLDRTGAWADVVKGDSDRLHWMEGELVAFANTSVLGIHFGSSLERFTRADHGTTMVEAFRHEAPHAILVKPDATVDAGLDRFRWVVEQPWIDVIGMSWTTAPYENNPQGITDPLRPFECTLYDDPVTAEITRLTKVAADSGKLVVTAAGNEPSPIELGGSLQGPPWMLGISGSEAGGQAKASFSENGWPDYVANYTWTSPSGGTTGNETYVGSGTSFSAPAAAGVVAEIVYRLRAQLGYSGGIVDGQLAPGVRAADVRAALNKTALLPGFSGYTVGFNASLEGPGVNVPIPDHTHPPAAPWLTAQWGHLDGRVVGPAVTALLSGDLGVPAEKAEVKAWKDETYAARVAYWQQWAEDCA